MNTIIKVAVAVLRVLYVPYKIFLKPRDKITMLSRQYNEEPISFRLTREALESMDPEVEVVTLAKKIEGNVFQKIGYCFHILRQMYHIATSKIVIVDGFCIPVSVLNHKKEQKFVQMWHALNIIKKFGYLALDKPAGVSSQLAKNMCMHRNYTHIVAGSLKTGEILVRSFDAKDAEVVILGLPYLDYIMSRDSKIIDKIRNKYPQLKEKETILYAPTFRKYRQVDISWIEEMIDLDKYNVIVKLHPVDRKGVVDKRDSRIVYDEEFSTYEWLWTCDSVITDYSGIGMESALLDKKLYFYLYDREVYEQEVGLNIDLYQEPISKYVCETAELLKERLQEEYDFGLLKAYREEYVQFDIKDCNKQFAGWLLEQV